MLFTTLGTLRVACFAYFFDYIINVSYTHYSMIPIACEFVFPRIIFYTMGVEIAYTTRIHYTNVFHPRVAYRFIQSPMRFIAPYFIFMALLFVTADMILHSSSFYAQLRIHPTKLFAQPVGQ